MRKRVKTLVQQQVSLLVVMGQARSKARRRYSVKVDEPRDAGASWNSSARSNNASLDSSCDG